jgi:orotidine-5'-phosphate decarboxylase
MTKVNNKIIVALDVATEKEAVALVEQLRDKTSWFKVGIQLYTAAGPGIVRKVGGAGSKIFLDLKFHDIPNTVASAVKSATELGVEMLSIHLSGGEAMIRAAVEAAEKKILVLGVTVLTSQTDETLQSVGVSHHTNDQVLRLARLGARCGIKGFVASAREAATLRAEFGNAVTIVTPGIRPANSEAGDQKRVTTPRQAISAGADYLVIGRPITADRNPAAALQKILEELESQEPSVPIAGHLQR